MTFTFLQQKLKSGDYSVGLQVRQKFSNIDYELSSANQISKKKKLTDFYNLMLLLNNGILDNQGSPSKAIITLSDYLNLEHTKDLPSLAKAWNKFFLRHPSTGIPIERWNLQRLGCGQELENDRQNIIELLQKTGLLNTKLAHCEHYDTLIVHGARLEDIMLRLKFIDQFWSKGGRFEKIVFLTGERFLADDELDQNKWIFIPYKKTYVSNVSTEIDLMQYAWLINNVIPSAVRQLPIAWINTPNFISNNAQVRRGVTEDTITAWLNAEFSAQKYDLGKCLAVANAPLVLRQHVVFERKMYERGINANIETVGLAEENFAQQWVIYYLREIAGLLWELDKLAS